MSEKPTLALMGEFSAGKSTLSNLLLGRSPLPVKVTATRLPPIVLTYGSGQPLCEDHEGQMREFSLEDLDQINPETTRLVYLQMKADFLTLCDLIDMPGISDPNMSPSAWRDVIRSADHVVWCTHATQAWRQSEAAAWASIRDHLTGPNLLLVTQFDKMRTQHDQNRLMSRLRSETQHSFDDIFAVSLLEAMQADDDPTVWHSSGAGPFVDRLIEMIVDPNSDGHKTYGDAKGKDGSRQDALTADPIPEDLETISPPVEVKRILPKRPKNKNQALRPRPKAPPTVEHDPFR